MSSDILFKNVFCSLFDDENVAGRVRCSGMRVPQELRAGRPCVRREGDDHRHGQRQDRGTTVLLYCLFFFFYFFIKRRVFVSTTFVYFVVTVPFVCLMLCLSKHSVAWVNTYKVWCVAQTADVHSIFLFLVPLFGVPTMCFVSGVQPEPPVLVPGAQRGSGQELRGCRGRQGHELRHQGTCCVVRARAHLANVMRCDGVQDRLVRPVNLVRCFVSLELLVGVLSHRLLSLTYVCTKVLKGRF